MCYQTITAKSWLNVQLVYCALHDGIRTILNMFHEILKISQDYDKVHPTRVIEETEFSNLGGEGENWCSM